PLFGGGTAGRARRHDSALGLAGIDLFDDDLETGALDVVARHLDGLAHDVGDAHQFGAGSQSDGDGAVAVDAGSRTGALVDDEVLVVGIRRSASDVRVEPETDGGQL